MLQPRKVVVSRVSSYYFLERTYCCIGCGSQFGHKTQEEIVTNFIIVNLLGGFLVIFFSLKEKEYFT